MPAPIALFVYNRPEHTRCVLEYLSRNEGSESSLLYIYSDGAKSDASSADIKKIDEVRSILRMKQWCKEVIIVEEKVNKGIYLSMTTAITELVNRHGKLIILEDDIVTSKYFLNYVNRYLTEYEKEETVMAISGYMFPVKGKLPELFFLRASAGWGWGTWKRAWEQFNPDSGYLIRQLEEKNMVEKFNFNNSYNYIGVLKGHHNKTLTAWDACWYATVFLKNGLSLYPRKSFTINIGMDGSGTHFTGAQKHKNFNPNAFLKWSERINAPKAPGKIEANVFAEKAIEEYFREQSSAGILSRIKNTIMKKISP